MDLALFLNSMGAKVSGHGTDTIIVDGVESLHATSYDVLPDRIEAGTYLLAGAITGGRVRARNARPEHLDAVLAKLEEAGAAGDRARWTYVLRRTRASRPTCRRSSRR